MNNFCLCFVSPDPSRFRRNLFGLVLLVVGMLSSPGRAALDPVDLDVALLALHDAYTSGQTQETIEVTVRRGLSSWRESFTIRIDPGSGSKRPPACRVELDQLAVYWARGQAPDSSIPLAVGRLLAVHERDAELFYAKPVDGMLGVMKLAEALLPVPAPQLAIALGDEAGANAGRTMRWLTPYSPSVTWTDAAKEPRRAPGDIVISGICDPHSSPAPGEPAIGVGKASMTIDEESGRLKRLFLEIDGGAIELELRVRTEKHLDRAEWGIATVGRREVPSLAQLGPRKGDATAAVSFPDIVMQDAKGRVWVTAEAFSTEPPAADRPAPALLALLFVRESFSAPSSGSVLDPAKDSTARAEPPAFENAHARQTIELINTLNQERENARPRQPPIALQVVLVVDQPDDQSRHKIERGMREWGSTAVWCSSPSASIDRFAPDARAAVVVIKRDRTLCGMVPLPLPPRDPPLTDTLADLLRRVVACVKPDTPPALPADASKP